MRGGPTVDDGLGHYEHASVISFEASLPKNMRSAIILGQKKIDGLLFAFGDADQGEAIILAKK